MSFQGHFGTWSSHPAESCQDTTETGNVFEAKGKTDRRTSCTQSSETGKCQNILVWLKYSDCSQVLKEPPVLTDLSKKFWGGEVVLTPS